MVYYSDDGDAHLVKGYVMTKGKRAAVACAVVGAVGIALIGTAESQAGNDVDGASAKAASDTVLQAMQAQQTIVVPTAQSKAGTGLSSVAAQNMSVRGVSQLDKLFTGPQADAEKKTLTNAISQETSDPSVSVDAGGADTLQVAHIKTVNQKEVIVTGSVRTWSTMTQTQAGGASVTVSPSNILNINVTLDRLSPTSPWKVSDLQWTFAPGSEP